MTDQSNLGDSVRLVRATPFKKEMTDLHGFRRLCSRRMNSSEAWNEKEAPNQRGLARELMTRADGFYAKANMPRSVFLNRASLPLTPSSLSIAE